MGSDGVTGREKPFAGVAPSLEESVRCPLLDREEGLRGTK